MFQSRIIWRLFNRARGGVSKLLLASAAVNQATHTNDAKKFEFSDFHLSHKQLIQQASCVAVNAASQLLTQTTASIIDVLNQYKTSLKELLSLVEEERQSIGSVPLDLSDLIIASRARTHDFKTSLHELRSYFEYVEKVVDSTSEASFLAGADYLATALNERLISAKLEIESLMKNITQLEQELLALQQEVIIRTEPKE